MSIKLSAVVITFNEAKQIENCLDALIKIADEIVVVDSGSTDNTVEISKKLGAKVLHQAWLGYSEQKNIGNEIAVNDWILSVDADEVLDEELITSIIKWKESPQVASFKRMTNYCGKFIKHGGWYPDIKIRLFNKKESKWVGTIHESLSNTHKKNSLLLQGHCLHYSYYSIDQHYAQTEKFTSIQAHDLFLRGKKSYLLKRIFSPIIKFITDYFLRLGFLDGKAGFTVARISSYATYLKYKKLNEHWVSK
ncbi:MAG: glycosyltransferase family 2 protein [Bacteroidota bacterium]